MKLKLVNMILFCILVCQIIMIFYVLVKKEVDKTTMVEDKIIEETIEFQKMKMPEIEVEVEIEEEPEPVFELSDQERQVVENIVMGESEGEPYEGQVLVAQCLLNACLKDGLQPSEVREEYQYSGWNDGPSNSVKKAVSAVFDDGYKVTDENILYFYAPKRCKSNWHETQKFVIEVGGHRFFSEWE